jgi:HEPN domain-containing protein
MKKEEVFSYFNCKPYMNFYVISEVDKFAIHSIAYLEAASKLNEITNRFSNWWLVAYYLLYHSIELACKAAILNKGGNIPFEHSILKISKNFKNILSFTEKEINTLIQIENLNSGPGQLRYPNEPVGEFYPNIFNDCENIVVGILSNIKDKKL